MDDPIPSTTSTTTRRTPWRLAAVAAVALVAIAGVIAFAGGDDAEPAGEPVALTAIVEDPLATICMEVTPDTLQGAGVEQAFRGTVSSVDGDVATLDVDEWFVGGDAATVTVTAPAGADVALLGTVPLEEGGTYLVSAADGAVLGCGLSGEASSELEAIYADAFG